VLAQDPLLGKAAGFSAQAMANRCGTGTHPFEDAVVKLIKVIQSRTMRHGEFPG
jgi:hypothetical protein